MTIHHSFWQRRSVFVTGATGLLGGWLVKDLVGQGAAVVALVRDGAPRSTVNREGLLDKISIVNGSLHDFELLRRTLCEYSVDTVFHLAAQTLVGVAKTDPLGTLKANIQGTWNVLEACRQSRARQIVVASSDKAYGPNEQLPYQETHPLQGKFPYDVSKSCADLVCEMYAVTYGLPVSIARCANIFGGGDLNSSRLIPDLIRSTMRGERFLIRSDGKFVRDLLYVKDAAAAYLCLAHHLGQNRSLAGEAFNFSLEIRMTVLAIVQKVLELMHRPDLEPIIQDTASSEVREQYLMCEKARRLLGWSPRYSLEEGLEETIAWYAAFEGTELEAETLSRAASQ